MIEVAGNPIFVAIDLPATLGFTENTLKYHLKTTVSADEKRVVKLPCIRGLGLTFISESALYKLVMRSDKPEARQFQDWVTREVPPAIRKDGAYIQGEERMAILAGT